MANYLISFPSEAMIIPEGEFETVVEESHAVVREMKAAGVWVFGGGIDEDVPPVMVASDGTVADGTYASTKELRGGFTVMSAESRDVAVYWAARIAAACRCAQELRTFQYDPES
jgi:hypothetical protein